MLTGTLGVFCISMHFLSVLVVDGTPLRGFCVLFLYFWYLLWMCVSMSDVDTDHTLDMDLDEEREEVGDDLDEEEEDDELDLGEDIDGSWPDKETSQIIELYRTSPQLYDVSHPSYPNRDKKIATLTRMAKELQCSSKSPIQVPQYPITFINSSLDTQLPSHLYLPSHRQAVRQRFKT